MLSSGGGLCGVAARVSDEVPSGSKLQPCAITARREAQERVGLRRSGYDNVYVRAAWCWLVGVGARLCQGCARLCGNCKDIEMYL
jgi:hypothetical protein